jgi:hypothetical protein
MVGDEFREIGDDDWRRIRTSRIGVSYSNYGDFDLNEYRRPIARYNAGKDSIYASDTKPVVARALGGPFDACTSNQEGGNDFTKLHGEYQHPNYADVKVNGYGGFSLYPRELPKGSVSSPKMETTTGYEVGDYVTLSEDITLSGFAGGYYVKAGTPVRYSGEFDYGYGPVAVINEGEAKNNVATVTYSCLNKIQPEQAGREKAVKEMCDLCWDKAGEFSEASMIALYDAGYRLKGEGDE